MKANKRSVKIAVIAISLLLVLALTLGITGAWYRAKRAASGTVKFDNGVIVDYKGFNDETADFAVWENTANLVLFTQNSYDPGATVEIKPAYIQANAKSLDFYARVKLTYDFYALKTDLNPIAESELTAAGFTSDQLITGEVFGTNWTPSSDGYYYYSTDGTTLALVTQDSNLAIFKDNAKLLIEGDNFGSNDPNNYLEAGAYPVNGTLSIEKIVVKLTLEVLQGNPDAATDQGWAITAGGASEPTGEQLTVGKTYDTLYVSKNASDYDFSTLDWSSAQTFSEADNLLDGSEYVTLIEYTDKGGSAGAYTLHKMQVDMGSGLANYYTLVCVFDGVYFIYNIDENTLVHSENDPCGEITITAVYQQGVWGSIVTGKVAGGSGSGEETTSYVPAEADASTVASSINNASEFATLANAIRTVLFNTVDRGSDADAPSGVTATGIDYSGLTIKYSGREGSIEPPYAQVDNYDSLADFKAADAYAQICAGYDPVTTAEMATGYGVEVFVAASADNAKYFMWMAMGEQLTVVTYQVQTGQGITCLTSIKQLTDINYAGTFNPNMIGLYEFNWA